MRCLLGRLTDATEAVSDANDLVKRLVGQAALLQHRSEFMGDFDFERGLHNIDRLRLLALAHTETVVEEGCVSRFHRTIHVRVVGGEVPVVAVKSNAVGQELDALRHAAVGGHAERGANLVRAINGVLTRYDRRQEVGPRCYVFEEGFGNLRLVLRELVVELDILACAGLDWDDARNALSFTATRGAVLGELESSAGEVVGAVGSRGEDRRDQVRGEQVLSADRGGGSERDEGASHGDLQRMEWDSEKMG